MVDTIVGNRHFKKLLGGSSGILVCHLFVFKPFCLNVISIGLTQNILHSSTAPETFFGWKVLVEHLIIASKQIRPLESGGQQNLL